MANCLAPGYIRIAYNSNSHDHHMTIPVLPDSVAPNFNLQKKGGGTVSQATAINALIALMLPAFTAADSFTSWEAFTQANCASAPVFQNGGSITAVGSSGGSTKEWVQTLLTFRSAAGGRGKLLWLEGVSANDTHAPLVPGGGTTLDAIADYVVSANSWLVARDNTFLNVMLNYTTKTNDTLRKKYLAL